MKNRKIAFSDNALVLVSLIVLSALVSFILGGHEYGYFPLFCIALSFAFLVFFLYSFLLYFRLKKYLETLQPLLSQRRLRRRYLASSPLFFLPFRGLSSAVERVLHKQDTLHSFVEKEVRRKTIGLERAREDAENVCRAQGDFLAVMSHEIRTPLNGIIGLTTLLEETELTEEQCRYVSALRASGDSLLGILNDILDFSRLEEGKLRIENRDFNIRELLDSFLETTYLSAEKKNLRYVLDTDPEIPDFLVGDPGRFLQVLMNLTSNAFKFTEEGCVAITIDVASADQDQVVLCCRVRDTGIGISEKNQSLIFDRFEQGDASIGRKFGGSGLGLAISRELCRLMGGDIRVTSAAGVGSEFIFTAVFGRSSEKEEQTASFSLQGTGRILVVDKNAALRAMLLRQLRHWGGDVVVAPSGGEALAELEAIPCSLVFLAMELPDMTGLELAEKIAERFPENMPRMVLLHRLAHKDPLGRLLNVNFSDFLMKPLRSRDLYRCMKKLHCGEKNLSRKGIPGLILPEKNARILVAEDDQTNQIVAQGLLRKLGYEKVDIVSNGKQALDAVAQKTYSMIFMDIQMQDMDGLEATRLIRVELKNTENQNLPIIALSAHEDPEIQKYCLRAGMTDYLTKPLSPDLLGSVLEKYLATADMASGGDDLVEELK